MLEAATRCVDRLLDKYFLPVDPPRHLQTQIRSFTQVVLVFMACQVMNAAPTFVLSRTLFMPLLHAASILSCVLVLCLVRSIRTEARYNMTLSLTLFIVYCLCVTLGSLEGVKGPQANAVLALSLIALRFPGPHRGGRVGKAMTSIGIPFSTMQLPPYNPPNVCIRHTGVWG